MIKKLILSKLVVGEFYQFMALVFKTIETYGADALKIVAQRDVFKSILNRLFDAYEREKAYELTKVLDELDQRRDIAISGFSIWIDGLTRHPNATKRESAKALKNYLDNYGTGIARQNDQLESTTLSKIVEDLANNAELKAHLSNLNDNEWLPEIKEANTLFIENYQKRTSQMGEDSKKESFSKVRKEMVPVYEDLIDMIGSRYKTAKADGSDVTVYEKTIQDINATIDQYKQLIAQTHPHKKDPKS